MQREERGVWGEGGGVEGCGVEEVGWREVGWREVGLLVGCYLA